MSGIAKKVGKTFRRLKKNKLVKTLAIAAAVWFAAGTASAYFAAPEAGLGSAMTSSASNMWTTTTEFFGGSAAATGQQAELAAQTAEFGAAGTEATNAALASAGGATEAGVSTMTDLAATETGKGIVGKAAAEGVGPGSWMKENPMATMMLGQGVSGAYQAHEAEKASKREDEYRRSRGLMGFDYEGKPGIVSSQIPEQMPAQRTVDQAVQEPTVSAPGEQVIRPIQRNKLPDLQRQGLIAQQRVV